MSDANEGPSEATGAESRTSALLDSLVDLDSNWFALAFYGFLLVWMVAILVVAWEWSWRDKLVPFIAGVPTVALLVVKLVKLGSPATYDRLTPGFVAAAPPFDTDDGETAKLEAEFEEAREETDVSRPQREQVAYAVRMTAWAMALPLLMYVIGFANALVLFVLGFGLRFFDSPRDAVLVTLGFSAFMYLFFYTIIGMQPWTGVLDIPSIVELVGLG